MLGPRLLFCPQRCIFCNHRLQDQAVVTYKRATHPDGENKVPDGKPKIKN